ncbi:hypothetical protein BDR07DRAFT_1376680 [Suillus spraguei]|nr:hypothetical protein BDR07DRAFT_1376680 [Suillus spraguei]
MPLKHKNEQQHCKAWLKSKHKCYERHKIDKHLKSRTHWRKHLGATVPGHSQYMVLKSQGLMLVHEVDDKGWQVVRPNYEHIVSDMQELLSEAQGVAFSGVALRCMGRSTLING